MAWSRRCPRSWRGLRFVFFLLGVAEAACWELGVAKGKGAEHFDCVV